ncbi:kinase-like domain-containing protein [Aspergillus californicus]
MKTFRTFTRSKACDEKYIFARSLRGSARRTNSSSNNLMMHPPGRHPHGMKIDFSHLDNNVEALNRFTSGRWLWREQEQLACRYLKFDPSKLLDIAASATDSKKCVQVVKVTEGQYNKVFLLTMDDGHEVIVKLSNPNAGRAHFTTASEVATMDFLRNVLQLPVPRVHSWKYIIMEKQRGVMLSDAWKTMKGKQKAHLILQIVTIEKSLATTKFTKYGSLAYQSPLFFDFGRGNLCIDRGPWSTAGDCMKSIAIREMEATKANLKYPLTPEGLFYGPRQYQPSGVKKLSALEIYLKVAPYVLPENTATHASILWHSDLNLQNIFVDPENPGQILGIIDWQSVSASPLFTQVTRPAFLEYNGPLPETLAKVNLPEKFDSLDAEEQRKAKALHQAQTLHNLYLAQSLKHNPAAFQAIKGQSSLRHQVSVTPGLTIMDYEPYLTSLLRDVEETWVDIVGTGPDAVPCPFEFSAAEIKEQEADEDLWAQGVQLMDEFVKDTGGFKHWDGRVTDADYEISRREFDEGIERFLGREARNDEEMKAWLEALPFVD